MNFFAAALPSIVSAIGKGASDRQKVQDDRYRYDIEAQTADKDRELKKRIQDDTIKKLLGQFETGREFQESGEQDFLNTVNKPSDYLSSIREDVLKNRTRQQTQALNTAKANLASQGIRGGRAATALNRQSGDLTSQLMADLNNLSYQDEASKLATKAGYFSNKALSGQEAKISGMRPESPVAPTASVPVPKSSGKKLWEMWG